MPIPPEPQASAAASAIWSFLGGLGGGAVALGVMLVKLQLDQLSARCDAFAKSVEGAMDLALDYWLLGVPEGATPHGPETDTGKARDAATEKHEIRLRAAQAALQADVERMAGDLPPNSRSALRTEFQGLVRAMTGERFGDRTGHTEPDLAQAAISSGTRLIRVVRVGRDDTSGVWNALLYVTGITAHRHRWSTAARSAARVSEDVFPCLLFAVTTLTPSALIAGEHCPTPILL